MKLGVVTICPHIFFENKWWSYEPFVLEMNLWNDLFGELWVVAPFEEGPPPDLWTPYKISSSVSVVPYRKNCGSGLKQKKASIFEIPRMLTALTHAAGKCDAFLVRSPGHISLIASLWLPLFCKQLCAKYAGQWNGYPGEPFTVRLQRFLLQSRWWGSPVLVYGHWPNQPAHIVPFFTSILSRDQMARAKRNGYKKIGSPLRILFVGRLSSAKNADILLKALAQLKKEAVLFSCSIVGDGPARRPLENLAASLGLNKTAAFEGGMPFEKVFFFYEKADVLVLASETEGWPKAVAEAMAFGLVCIGSDRGFLSQMLSEGRGLLVPPGDITALAGALRHIAENPNAYETMRVKAAGWAQAYTLEDFKEAIAGLLGKHWKIPWNAFRTRESNPKPAVL